MGKHLADGGGSVIVRLGMLLLVLRSLCVSAADDVNLSSSQPQKRALEPNGGAHAPSHAGETSKGRHPF